MSMGGVAACVIASMYLADWGLGFMESICVTVLVGLVRRCFEFYTSNIVTPANSNHTHNNAVITSKVDIISINVRALCFTLIFAGSGLHDACEYCVYELIQGIYKTAAHC